MKRVKSLGSVIFNTNTLFIQEEFTNNNLLAEARVSAAGTRVEYVALNNSPDITIQSLENGWIDEVQRQAITAMFLSIDSTFLLKYNDDSTDTIRFKHDAPPIFTQLFEGAEMYTATIFLIKD